MKICICTTPIRPVPTSFPPMGSIAIIESLRKIGEYPEFFNIDYFRPDKSAVEAKFQKGQYDIVGISAVVSTAYAYTKFLCKIIRQVSPKTIIIIGGNLAASAEILLRKCDVDLCVSGDGEIVIKQLVTLLREQGMAEDGLVNIKGICYLDKNREFIFTGFGPRPSPEEIEFPDYDIIDQGDALNHFIPEILDDRFGVDAPEGGWPKGRMATVPTTKGCVSRCTFCHRWEKGFRVMPINNISDHLTVLQNKYNVKYIDVADENFGSDKQAAKSFAEELSRRGMIWRAGGVRASTVNLEMLKFWKSCGCANVTYGMESGSQTMLDVMEKKITVEQNFNAVVWTYEANLPTVLQLIIGMPGETDKTIAESISFLKKCSDYLFLNGGMPSSMLSLNYAQALPGTPLYEYARERGFIGKDINEEESYLIRISDTDAYKSDHFINYTGLPMLKVLAWQQQILAEIDADYLQRKFATNYSLGSIIRFYGGLVTQKFLPNLLKNIQLPSSIEDRSENFKKSSGFYNIREGSKFFPLLMNPITKPFFMFLVMIGIIIGKSKDSRTALNLVFEYFYWLVKRPFSASLEATLPKKSLRKIVNIIPANTSETSNQNMLPLREGR